MSTFGANVVAVNNLQTMYLIYTLLHEHDTAVDPRATGTIQLLAIRHHRQTIAVRIRWRHECVDGEKDEQVLSLGCQNPVYTLSFSDCTCDGNRWRITV